MTPAEVQFLAQLGTYTYYDICQYITMWVLYGVFIIPAIMAIYLFLINGYSRKVLLACMIMVILMNTWNYIVNTAGVTIARGLEGGFIAANVASEPWGAQDSWPGTITLLISDAIVTWRACVVWPTTRLVWYMLIAIMIGNIAINIAGCIVQDTVLDFLGPISLDLACLFISFGVNLIATLAIGLKVWYHHHATQALYSNRKQKFSPTSRILLLLVESGALFCILQLLIAILTVLGANAPLLSPLESAFRIITEFFTGITSIYPMAIIIMLNLNHLPLQETFHHDFDDISNSHPVQPTATTATT
ncbi:hypothetical protein BT96DRAFT_917066 [Gymnopus androsaceus JB14]|uniref:Fungal pheromone STE3G-protein-coupled receptor n=1 Tax=Gymnopus androsaceus JB14 TaxID=1447944 RepID=A0A6A4I171_9AGAR|nr:hypothetical protein BT96DRAFT_917066 [Gymnopus androsaceus JB14]